MELERNWKEQTARTRPHASVPLYGLPKVNRWRRRAQTTWDKFGTQDSVKRGKIKEP